MMMKLKSFGSKTFKSINPYFWGNLKHYSTSSFQVGPLTPSQRKDFAKRHLTPGIGRLTDLEFVKGEGSWMIDSNNRKFLDFTCGIGVTNLGHCHPKIVKAAQEQLEKLVHSQVNISWHKPMLDLIEKMKKICPPSLDTFFFWNSGAEAVEAAIKVARNFTKKQNVIVVQGSYHGRTFGTMSLTTSKTIYRSSFGPLLPGVFVTPYPYCFQCEVRKASNSTECCNVPIRDFEMLLKQQTSPEETAAFIIEPILGEGGYIPPPPGYLEKISEICRKHNILFIVDEVQSGMGRTGKYFAIEHYQVEPDIIIFAKGIANGLPLSGIVSKQNIMQVQKPGSMGGTYAGNAVACAAASAVIDVLQEENILDNVTKRGDQLRKGLMEIQQKYPMLIKDIRGKGLMIGLELDRNREGIANLISQKCLENGMLILTAGPFQTFRFIPPLNVTSSEIDLGLQIFEKAISQVVNDSIKS